MSKYNPFEERRKNERINRLTKENTELKAKVDKLEQGYDSKRLYANLMEQAVKFAQSQTQELQEQNGELLRALQSVYNLLNVDAKISVESIRRILRKHNHLNKM